VDYGSDLLSVLQNYLTFPEHQASSSYNLAAYCPFHKGGKESKPSFYVYVGPPTSNKRPGAAFCHTCNEGWSFTGLLKKLSVPNKIIDSIKQHVDYSAPERKIPLKVAFSWDILPEAILGTFSYLPKKLIDDGFAEDILKEYEIGFDRPRKRIIFPIRNHHGELVAISGRTISGRWPRYKLYKEELEEVVKNYSFDRKNILWGLEKFYETRMYTDIKIDTPVVVCEGFKAALWVVQSGHPHTVALLGSYLSREQEMLLSRITNSVVLFLDNDEAGYKATRKIVENRLPGVEVRVAKYKKDEKDKSPDDLGVSQVREAIDSALTIINWRRSYQ